jgi:cation diffusion facilitator CzcD-associated flavoprotein CzcO
MGHPIASPSPAASAGQHPLGDPIGALIVGAGFAGLAMGFRLLQAQMNDFLILERSERIGGTWRDNTYPNAACDTESHLYSFSFEKNPAWSRAFAAQPEILQYLEDCADKRGLRRHIRCGVEVSSASFDEAEGLWVVRTSDGSTRRARVLISCCGFFGRPAYPEIAGISKFGGEILHSARWRDTASFEGRVVAVVGTGASAIQLVPALAQAARQVYVFQRTPPWILPKRDRAISRLEQSILRRVPLLQHLLRLAIYWKLEARVLALVFAPWLLKPYEIMARRHLRNGVPDPERRAKLTPSFALGCKRILLSNDYYEAVRREDVEVVTEGIREIETDAIVSVDGRSRQVDAIVFATGFHVAEAFAPFDVYGLGGRDLNQVWKHGAEAYLGTTVSGFPNFFTLFGPNTALGHSSVILMIEAQADYIIGCLRWMHSSRVKFVDVKLDVQARYNEKLQKRLRRSVWSSGCKSWYQTASGKNTTNWPGFTFEFYLRTSRFNPKEYTIEAA